MSAVSSFTIGILGGMGPRATVEFERRLVDKLEGNDQQIPRIITINDGTIWDRTQFLTENGNDPLEQLIPNARLLFQAGVNVVCLPCNTAHAPSILSRLQAIVPLPIIDMPSACLASAEQASIEQLLILGTDGTRRTDVYQSRSIGCRTIKLSNNEQQVLSTIIEYIKKGEFVTTAMLAQVVRIITKAACDGVVLACTELSLIKERLTLLTPQVIIFDSLDELAGRCVALYNERKEYVYEIG